MTSNELVRPTGYTLTLHFTKGLAYFKGLSRLKKIKRFDSWRGYFNISNWDQEYSQFFQCFQGLKVEGKILSSENFKARYNGYNWHLYTLEDIFKYHNDHQFSKLRGNTSRLYITSQNYIRRFVKKEYKIKDFYFKELDCIRSQFKRWLNY